MNRYLAFLAVTWYFFLTGTCIDIMKSSGVRNFCPKPGKNSAGLTRFDYIFSNGFYFPMEKSLGIFKIED